MKELRSSIGFLTGGLKERLIQEALALRTRRAESGARDSASPEPVAPVPTAVPASESVARFDQLPGYRQLRLLRAGAAQLGIENPFFRIHEGIGGATTIIAGREYINYSSYNYLGLCGHPQVQAAAGQAIERYGTSVSASRLVSGERPIHRELERALAQAYQTEDCVAFVSGHATNVSAIATLFGARDLVLHDALIHNSVLQGITLSGARRMAFAHNDAQALEELLREWRGRFERVLIVLEGVYGMDGDFPDLPRFVDVKRRHRAFLMVDEAHSLGVLGASGLGIREHFGLHGSDVDIWMGTLSKTLASCGGFVAGDSPLVEHLKCLAPGFLYSVGMAPPVAAAALAALEVLQAEPARVHRLRERGALFLDLAREQGIDTGTSAGLAVIPAVTGSSIRAGRLAQALFRRGINVQPIVHPAVPEQASRLRFFVSSEHTPEQIRATVQALAQESEKL